ncbi:MAG TPA: metal ABC transporter permease, partial [Nitrososphaeraceae archaeon]
MRKHLIFQRFSMANDPPAISAMMVISSTIIGIVISFLGLYSSYFFDSSSGSTVVLFGAVAFGFSVLYVFMHISL